MADLLAYAAYAVMSVPTGAAWMAGHVLIAAGLLAHWRTR